MVLRMLKFKVNASNIRKKGNRENHLISVAINPKTTAGQQNQSDLISSSQDNQN